MKQFCSNAGHAKLSTSYIKAKSKDATFSLAFGKMQQIKTSAARVAYEYFLD